jgi:protein-disulfide isomerase
MPGMRQLFRDRTPQLVDKYVKTGQVSFEFRHLVRDPADLAAALVARCGGPTPFFK